MYEATRVAVNSTLGACAGGVGGILGVLVHTRGTPDIISSLNGILGGLVSITGGALYFEPYISIVVGFLGGLIVFHVSRLLQVSRSQEMRVPLLGPLLPCPRGFLLSTLLAQHISLVSFFACSGSG